jgi:probable HAF family extracellular repeat protein
VHFSEPFRSSTALAEVENKMNTHASRRRLATAAASFLISAATIPLAQAQPSLAWRYNIVKLDYPYAPVSFPLGINSSRDIVGVRVDANGTNHGYLYKDGKFTDIDYPGALQSPGGGTFTGGINDRGDIAGTFTDAQGFQHGFVRTTSGDCASGEDSKKCKVTYTQIDMPGAVQTTGIVYELGTGLGTAVAGINNQGDVAGMFATPGLWSDAFSMSHGKFTSIDDPVSTHVPSFGSRAFALNDAGVVAGAYIRQPSPTAYPFSGGFIFDGRNFTSVFVPNSEQGGFGTQANGINNRQEVVGVFTDPTGVFHGMLWMGGQAFTVDVPGVPYTECHSINSRGDITGAYLLDPNGFSYRGFVAYLKGDE